MLTTSVSDGVTVVRMDHGKVNALDLELCDAIAATFAGLRGPVVLTGNDRVFSAGVDLHRVLDGGDPYVSAFLVSLGAAFRAVFECPGPVVAAVNGHAIAGGCVLAAAADVRVMSGGTIGLSELRVGVPFPVAALEIMRHHRGPGAQRAVLESETVPVAEAVSRSIVEHAADAADLLPRSLDLARSLGAVPAAVYALSKRQLRAPAVDRMNAGASIDAAVSAHWRSAEGLAAVAAFTRAAFGR